MSTRSSRDRDAARTEARRRARLAARGELVVEEPEAETEPARRSGGFLSRLFPGAPPLPDRPDPLIGFERDGPLRPVRERLFLLRANPWSWLGFGLVAFFGFYASQFFGNTVLGLIGTFVMFGALIAAGWYGWQRPSLYGTAAGILSFIFAAVLIVGTFASRGATPETFGTPETLVANLGIGAAYQAGLGFLGGWYGGYLRRRQTDLNARTRPRR